MKHLDIGTIHAFLDGELMGAPLEEAAAHFALCETCSNAMLAAESETAAVDMAFAAENAFAVPTQRIWARINNEIDALDAVPAATVETERAGWFDWSRISRFLTPSAAFASGLALVVMFSIFSFNRQPGAPDNGSVEVAQNSIPQSSIPNPIAEHKAPAEVNVVGASEPIPVQQTTAKNGNDFKVVKASHRVVEPKTKVVNSKPNPTAPKTKVDINNPLPEERLYLDTIDELAQTVASSDENAMRPSFRVEYEQNIALMDNAIKKMQKQVRRNTNDENAKRILFASYQNKIDLLNTVTEKTQLMATLR